MMTNNVLCHFPEWIKHSTYCCLDIIIDRPFCNIVRRHWSLRYRMFFVFPARWSCPLFSHWSSTTCCPQMTLYSCSNAPDWQFRYGPALRTVHRPMVLVWGTFLLTLSSFTTTHAATATFISITSPFIVASSATLIILTTCLFRPVCKVSRGCRERLIREVGE